MDMAELIKLAAQAGGPTIVALAALMIIRERDKQTIEILRQQQTITDAVLKCQTENTEALTRLTTIIDVQGDVQEQVRDLLIKLNGRSAL